jgi:signal transduction histidine kinase/CheY-like chemotaxis protein/HPt (histidine-containing phosphotransfer) domain-containing protein
MICLALGVAGLTLFVREQTELGLALAALLALAGTWMLGKRAAKAPAAATAEPPALEGADATLIEVAWRCTQRIAQSPSLDAALLAVRKVLEEELGAMGVRILRVEPHPTETAWVRVIEPAFAEIPGYRPVAVSLPLSRFPVGAAIQQQHVLGDEASGYAAPVCYLGDTVAVLEVASTTLPCKTQPMQHLLGVLGAQLSQCHGRGLVGLGGAASPAEPAAQAPVQAAAPAAQDGDAVQQFNDMMQALPEAAFLFDTSLTLLDINPAAEQHFGLSRQQVLGRNLRHAFNPVLAALAEPAMLQALAAPAAGGPGPGSSVACDYDWSPHAETPKRTRSLHVENVVVRHPDGSPRCLLAVARDVTLERRAQRELSEAQAVLHQFAETVDESLFVTNPERTQFYFLAGSLFDVWGVTRGRLAAEPGCILLQVIDEDKPLIAERMAIERAGRPCDLAFRIHHPTKGRRWLRSRTRCVVLPNGEQRVYGTVSDVTEDKRREAELRAARDAAEGASMAKSQFLANMSHEIRTPMNGILGMTELLLGTPLQDNQKRFAQAVYRSGESLLEIINDILDFSKIEAGKLELARTDFSLRGVVEDTLELLAPRAHEKGLDIGFREAPGMPAAAHGDALRLRQVLTNLVANAIKFTQSGEVVVDLHRLPKGGLDELWVEFNIRDTGIGIEAEKIPQLFNAFTQVSSDMSRRYGGTGLGLAISKQLVELMGGQVRVTSAPGQGSEFSFTLPLQAAQSALLNQPLDESQMPALRVLVVDDHATNRTVLKNMLGAWGMTVTLAHDGQQAFDLLSDPARDDETFDLALIDMHMPAMDGMALAQAIKEGGRHRDMRMVLLSSVSSPDDASAALNAGFHRFVPKPVRKAELRQTIAGLWAAKRESEQGPGIEPLLAGHVLVVEDNPVNQEVIGQMLRSLGLRVQMASGAMHGLRSLCEAHFDLVLMDIMMPGMDGVEAVSWFRRGPGARFQFKTPSNTPVIAVTANALDGDEERFLSLGFNDYLSKPFRQNQLLTMLTRYLRPNLSMAAASGSSDNSSSGASPAAAAAAPAAIPPLTPSVSAHGAVLDRTALERLRELDPNGQNKLMQRVVSAFESSVARMVPQVQQASRNNDRDGMRHVAHTLKSSSASIGALRLSKMCADLESIIRLQRSDDTAPHVAAICLEIEVVLQALRELNTGAPSPAQPQEKSTSSGVPAGTTN